MPSFTFANHWKCCNRNGGHAILLGVEYSLWSDYQHWRQLSFNICLLGFSFGLKWPPGESEKLWSEKARYWGADVQG